MVKKLLPILFVFLLTGCQKDENEIPEMGEKVEVVLSTILTPEETPRSYQKIKTIIHEDEQNGLKTEWTNTDRLKVFYKNAYGRLQMVEMVPKSVDKNVALFKAEILKRDVPYFNKHIWAISDNEIDYIHAEISNNSITVNVNLEEQNGDPNLLNKYDLLFGEGKANEDLAMEHQLAVVSFKLNVLNHENETRALKVFDTSFLSEDKRTLFNRNVSFIVGQNGLERQKTEGMTFLTCQPNLISNDNLKLYFMVVPKKKLKGKFSIAATICFNEDEDNTKTYRKKISFTNGKTFDKQVVERKTLNLKTPDDVYPNVGDYLYSDGSWGKLKYYTEKEPVAYIFSNEVSDEDKAKGYKHGYALALCEAVPSKRVFWNHERNHSNWKLYQNLQSFNFENLASQLILKDLNGLTNSQTIYPNTKQYDYYYCGVYKKMAAVPAAWEYMSESWKRYHHDYTRTDPRYYFKNFESIPNASHWYLPSLGQYTYFICNEFKLSKNEFKKIDELTYEIHLTPEQQSQMEVLNTTMNKKFSTIENPILQQYQKEWRIPQSEFQFFDDIYNSSYKYWTSTPGGVIDDAAAICFNGDIFTFTRFTKSQYDNFVIRPCIAF